MNLNKQMKEEIVSRVIADIPRDFSDQNKFQERVRAILLRDAERQLPTQILALWLDKESRKHLAYTSGSVVCMTQLEIGSQGRYAASNSEPFRRCDTTRPAACNALHAKSQKELDELLLATEAEVNRIDEARRTLQSAIAGIRTRKQFLKLLPELEKYLPEESKPSKLLPAITNVVADLSKLGWPKGEVAELAVAA